MVDIHKNKSTFVSEPIKPVVATSDPNAMAAGGPGLPRAFVWRGETLGIAAVLRTWRETGPCKHGSSEMYVRKHWFEVVTTANQAARIYFERQPRGRNQTRRWWLFSIEESQSGSPGAFSLNPDGSCEGESHETVHEDTGP
jgi:hypothetical protein